jgi:hypothetical protein
MRGLYSSRIEILEPTPLPSRNIGVHAAQLKATLTNGQLGAVVQSLPRSDVAPSDSPRARHSRQASSTSCWSAASSRWLALCCRWR